MIYGDFVRDNYGNACIKYVKYEIVVMGTYSYINELIVQ